MVVIDGSKYACEQCIRGHRVSGCNHVDKPLTMIKKKGRPATHCSHCRKGKQGKSGRGVSTHCPCGQFRYEKTVITPKDLRALQLEQGIRVEFTDGSLLPPLDAESSTDYSTASSTATPATVTDSPPGRSPAAPSEKPVPAGPRPLSVLASSRLGPKDDFNPYDPIGSSSSYSKENSVEASTVASMSGLGLEQVGRYGQPDGYLSVPAFQYEAGFLSQPYSEALYNSPAGNNAAAAEANAGGESTAAVANVGHASNAPFIGVLTDETKGPGSLGQSRHPAIPSMPHHSLLSTSSQDLDASMSALAPLVTGAGRGPSPAPDIDREELVGSILRSSTKTSPEIRKRKPELKKTSEQEEDGEVKDDTGEVYSSVQAMPELSSLY